MASLSTKPNRFYPSIPGIVGDAQIDSNALRVIRESIETHERRNNNYMKSFIRFEELVDLGIINASGEFIFESTAGGVPEAPVDGNTYGRKDAGWIQVTSGVSDHLLLSNIGTNSHAQIDSHIADTTIHFTLASLDSTFLRLDCTNDPLTATLTITGGDLQLDHNQAIQWEDGAGTPTDMLRFGTAPGGDPFWTDVLYLAKWEGTDGQTSYTELAQSDTHTFYGNAQIDTAFANFDSSSLLLDGTSDGVQTAGSAIYQLASTNDVTVEGFVRFTALPTSGNRVQLYNHAQQDAVSFQAEFFNNAGTYELRGRFGFGNFPAATVTSPTTGVQYHFAIQRRYNGGAPIVDLFWNGTRIGSVSSSNNPSSMGSVPITVGAWDNATTQVFTEVLNGHLDDLRVTRAARYGDVGSYTVPTASYPTVAATEVFEVGNVNEITDVLGSEVRVNGTALTHALGGHTGEVTGTTALTVQVEAITNKTALPTLADPTDELGIHDQTDGLLKKTPVNYITDGGYF